MKIRPIIILILVLAFFFEAAGQNHFFRQYSDAEGLTHSYVYGINQDNAGYLWIGTPDGLYKFNGFDFELFTAEDGLADLFITRLFKDSSGRIWIGHQNGDISLMEEEGFTIFNEYSDAHGTVTDFVEDGKGSVWFTSQNQGLVFIDKELNVNHIDFPDEYESLTQIQYVGTDTFIIGTQENLFLTKYNNDASSMDILHRYDSYPGSKVVDILHEPDRGYIIVSQDDGIYGLRPDSVPGEFLLVTIDENLDGALDNLQGGLVELSGWLWLNSMGNGVIQYRPGINNTYERAKRISLENGLVSDNIRSMFEDSEGNLWFGTYGDGILRYVDNNLTFFNFRSEGQTVGNYAFARDSLDFFILSGNRLLWMNPSVDTITQSYQLPDIGAGDLANTIYLDNDGRIWIGFEHSGLFTLDPEKMQLMPVFLSNDELTKSINHITGDEEDIWVSTKKGVFQINWKTGSRKWYTTDDGLPHNNVNQLYIDAIGRVLIASLCNEIYYINKNNTFEVLENIYLGSLNSVGSFAEDENGGLWIGTHGNGLWLANPDTLMHFTRSSGLFSDFCYALAITGEGQPIIGHTGGLSLINLESSSIKTFSHLEGMKSNSEIFSNAVLKDKYGNVWMGSSNGVIKYSTRSSKNFTTPPLPQLTSVRIDGKVIDHSLGSVHLKPGQYEILAEYIWLNLRNPEGVSYQARLDGYNKGWSESTDKRSAVFERVGHGNYSLNIRASNEDNIGGVVNSAFDIYIKKPFYLIAWFWVFVGLSMLAIFYFILRMREKSQIERQEFLEKELEKRTSELVIEKNEIERLNKDMTDSISYAQKIQESTLPPIERIKYAFKGAFVLYQPRDIVSGDFFYFEEFPNGKAVLVCADSTGHGVPGAFISIIGISKIKEICGNGNIESPSSILKLLDNEIKSALSQDYKEFKIPDGIDLVVAVIDLNSKKIIFSSAMNPVILYKSDEQVYLTGSKVSVGGRDFGEKKIFKDHVYFFEKGDKFYLFSDGYVDQFGGPRGKKLKTSGFKALVHDIHNEPMDMQYEFFKNQLNSWKGELEQIDDILLMGFEL